MGVEQFSRQQHEACAVGPDQRAFHRPPREGVAQHRAVGGHLAQIKGRHALHPIGWRAVGLVVQYQDAFGCNQQPVHLPAHQPVTESPGDRRLGQRTRPEGFGKGRRGKQAEHFAQRLRLFVRV